MKYDKTLLKNPNSKPGTTIRFKDHPEFAPNLTPRHVIQMGSFGGTYWRDIYSSVIGKKLTNQHKNRHFKGWWKDIPKHYMVTNFDDYDISINKFKVMVGTTLEFWEQKGWISDDDPYGWFQWYCHFYAGRRLGDEDERQIKRWAGVAGKNGRFRKRLVNMIKDKNKQFNDPSVSPRIRQTLQHWGIMITKHD